MTVDNELTGEIPTEFGLLTNLIQLHTCRSIEWMVSSAPIPCKIRPCCADDRFFLSTTTADNELVGDLPQELGNLASNSWIQCTFCESRVACLSSLLNFPDGISSLTCVCSLLVGLFSQPTAPETPFATPTA